MVSPSATGVYDLRSAAVDYQRDRESKHKWALGTALGPGRREADGNFKPARLRQKAEAADRKYNEKTHRKVQIARKQPIVRDESANSDSTVDEDVMEASAAPVPDADITYSYDASHGPGHGSQILNTALNHAVERFENKVTDKLVKDEYEVLDGAEVIGEGIPHHTAGAASTVDEDDYEFV